MRLDRSRTAWLLGVAGALLVGGVLLVALPFVMLARQQSSLGAVTASVTASATRATQPAASGTQAPAPVVTTPTSGPVRAPVPVPLSAPSLDAYRGLGAWVDLYDPKAWRNPEGTVADMASHGVHTLFIETSNSGSKFAMKDSWRLAVFIREAHARNMRIVAWYLPSMKRPDRDFGRISQAIAFRTPEGQAFDGFALDIEASTVKPLSARNRAVSALSTRIRSLVGTSYPLGAIIPSPSAIARKRGYWDRFPYESLAGIYDVFMPMGYYTYHGKGAKAAYADTRANVRVLRAQKGCADKPIHLVGGLSGDSSAAEVRAFVRGVNATGVMGASIYDWVGTTKAQWRALEAVKP